IERALTLLLTRFCDPEPDEGYLREGNVAVAQFEIEGAADDTEIREARILRQRAVNDPMLEFLSALGIASK
ncbi:antitoxin, partial [Rhizobium ruizarguesonis]